MCRCASAIILRSVVFQLLFADDVNWMASGVDGIRDVVVSLFFMSLVGTPFSWKKMEGGFVYGWIGYQLDLDKHALGISQERAAWLVGWIRDALKL